MGQRGPVKGTGGRPPGGNKPVRKKATRKKATRKKAAKKKPAKRAPRAARASYALTLADLTLPELERLAGEFQPLTDADGLILRLFWDALERYTQLREELVGRPLTFETEKGYSGPCPQVKMLDTCVLQIITLAGKFGMSPANRVRLGDKPDAPPEHDDPFSLHMTTGIKLHANAAKKKQPQRR